MKKIATVCLLAALAAALTGCSGKQAETETTMAAVETTAAPTTETTEPTTVPTEPASIPGTVVPNKAGAIIGYLPRGEQVEILDENEDCFVVNTAAGTGLVEKRLVRLNNQPQPEVWTGYAKWNAAVYDGYHMMGEGTKLNTNAKLEILDDLGGCYLVKTGEIQGYIPADSVSLYPASSGGSSDSGSGGGSGSSGSSGGGSYGQDGGDISLAAFHESDYCVVLLSNRTMGAVLAEDTEVYAGYLNRGEAVKVTEYDEKTCTIYLDGIYAQLPRQFVRLDEDAPYEVWTGYARWNAEAYGDPYLQGEPEKLLKTNTEVQILEDFGYCYGAEIDGEFFFLRPDHVSKWKASSGSGSSDGGGGGSSSSGGGGSSGGGEWTPPML